MSTNPNEEMLARITGPNSRKPRDPGGGGQDGPLEPDAQRALGKYLADQATKEKRTPIIPLGPDAAGKTTLLAALFRPRPSLDVRWSTDSGLLARDRPLGGEIAPAIQGIRNIDVSNLPDYPVRATRFRIPFFIPLELRPRLPSLPVAKLAYLESRGEFYRPVASPDAESGRNFYTSRPFPEVLAEFLRCYEGPVTCIHVAPCDDAAGDKRPADDAILFGLENYQSVRREAHASQDSHLFLATKWDRVARNIGLDAYMTPPPYCLEGVLRRQFRESWLRFQGMQREASGISHTYMQYIGTANANEHYPNTVLNWIYKGIHGRDLFAAVVPPKPPGWIDKARDFLGL